MFGKTVYKELIFGKSGKQVEKKSLEKQNKLKQLTKQLILEI